MWQFRWLRRFMRRNTRPIKEDRARFLRQRLSLLYMFFAWNAFGYVAYITVTKNKGKETIDALFPSGERWADILGVDKTKIIRFSGMRKVSEYDYVRENVDSSNQEESSLSE